MRADQHRQKLAYDALGEPVSPASSAYMLRQAIPYALVGVFFVAAFAFAGNYMGQNAVARTSAEPEVQASLVAPSTDLATKGSLSLMGDNLSVAAFRSTVEPVILEGKGDLLAQAALQNVPLPHRKPRNLAAQKIIVTPAAYSEAKDNEASSAKLRRVAPMGDKSLVVSVAPGTTAKTSKKAVIAQRRVQLAEENCLARAIYFEARSETTMGQLAVAKVILNRVKAPGYPKSICGVVYQGTTRRNSCQFSFACDGMPDDVRNPAAWANAKSIAQRAIAGTDNLKIMSTATNYHADYVRPRWANGMKRLVKIGRHIFYSDS